MPRPSPVQEKNRPLSLWDQTTAAVNSYFRPERTPLQQDLQVVYSGDEEGDCRPLWRLNSQERQQRLEAFKTVHNIVSSAELQLALKGQAFPVWFSKTIEDLFYPDNLAEKHLNALYYTPEWLADLQRSDPELRQFMALQDPLQRSEALAAFFKGIAQVCPTDPAFRMHQLNSALHLNFPNSFKDIVLTELMVYQAGLLAALKDDDPTKAVEILAQQFVGQPSPISFWSFLSSRRKEKFSWETLRHVYHYLRGTLDKEYDWRTFFAGQWGAKQARERPMAFKPFLLQQAGALSSNDWMLTLFATVLETLAPRVDRQHFRNLFLAFFAQIKLDPAAEDVLPYIPIAGIVNGYASKEQATSHQTDLNWAARGGTTRSSLRSGSLAQSLQRLPACVPR